MADAFRFLIDEVTLRDAASGGAEQASQAFADLVVTVESVRPHPVGKLSTIWEELVGPSRLYEWLFDPALGVDREVALAFQVVLGRTPDWDSAWDGPDLSLMPVLPDGAAAGASMAAAGHQNRAGHATACLSPEKGRSGVLALTYADGSSVDVHFIANVSDVLAFFRSVPAIEGLDEEAYFENARFAFPGIIFVREGTHFGSFDEAYGTVREKVTRHLAVLNDHAREILGTADPASVKQARFGAHGIDASGESGNTKRHTAAMKQRDVVINGKTITCDWHTKIRRHIDRIYFNATSLDRVVVAVFNRHLD